jgi:ABC-type nitrate/sulfonate/bicarbonate transport system permease component
MFASARAALGGAVPLLLVLALWEAVGASGIADRAFLPSIATIGAALIDLLRAGALAGDLAITMLRSLAGLVGATVVGTVLGVLMATSARIDRIVGPLVGATYSLPKTALVPLFLLWFGIGSATDIAVVFLACLLPILVHAYHGAKDVPPALLWSAAAMGTKRRRMRWRILLRWAEPPIWSGLRIALGFSVVVTVSAEMIASTNGLGKLIFMYGENGAYAHMFAAVGVLVAAAFALDRLLLGLMRHRLAWHESTTADVHGA